MGKQVTLEELIDLMELEVESTEPFTEYEKKRAEQYQKRKSDSKK